LDGEEGHIRVLTRADIAEKFKQHRIVLGKTPRSCSGICQASDTSEGFKSEHKSLSKATKEETENELLDLVLKRAFDQYKIDNAGTALTAAKTSSYINGLIAMSYVTPNVQTPRIVRGGYIDFGQQGGHIDLSKILNACRSNISADQFGKMIQSVPFLSGKITELGEIPEDYYDDCGIDGAKGAVDNAKEAGNSYYLHAKQQIISHRLLFLHIVSINLCRQAYLA
jgi:hypothetical protein